MSEKYAMIDIQTGYIINIIIWDEITPFDPPENTILKLFSSLKEEEIIFFPKP